MFARLPDLFTGPKPGMIVGTVVKAKRDYMGSLVGLGVFLGGIALMLFVFKQCYELFSIPVDHALGLEKGGKLDYNTAGTSFVQLLIRILVLILMAVIGGMVSERGIRLYARSLHLDTLKPDASGSSPVEK